MRTTRLQPHPDNPGCPAPYHGDDNAYRNAEPPCRCPDAREDHRLVLKRAREGRYEFRLVDPTGTVRRLRALAVIGWRFDKIAAELGVHPSYVAHLARAPRSVNRVTADRVQAVYDELSTHPGPSQHSATRAQRRGWIGPEEWLPGEIDDPDADPRRIEDQAHDEDVHALISAARYRSLDWHVLTPNDQERVVTALRGPEKSLAQVADQLRVPFAEVDKVAERITRRARRAAKQAGAA